MYFRSNGPEDRSIVLSPAVPAVRPWSQLSDEEKRMLIRDAVDRATRQRLSPSGVPIPPAVLRAFPTTTQTVWDNYSASKQAEVIRLAAAAPINQPRPGTTTPAGPSGGQIALDITTTVLREGASLARTILEGNLQRSLAQITAQAGTDRARIEAETQRFIAQSNQQIATLNAGLAEAQRTGNAAAANEMREALAATTRAQEAANARNADQMRELITALAQRGTPQAYSAEQKGLPTAAWVGIGVGGLVVVGLGVYLIARKG